MSWASVVSSICRESRKGSLRSNRKGEFSAGQSLLSRSPPWDVPLGPLQQFDPPQDSEWRPPSPELDEPLYSIGILQKQRWLAR